jgi:hypothetical protein
MKTRTWILLGAALAAAIAFSTLAERGHRRSARAEAEVAEEAAPVTASGPSSIAPSPSAREELKLDGVVAGFPARNENRDHRDAPVVNGVVRIGPPQIWKGATPPPPPPPTATAQTNTSWATSYAVAMCECRTRACAADLQGRFIHQMGAAEFDESRDGESTREALHKAVTCYAALPVDT